MRGPCAGPLPPPALPFMRIKGSKTRRGDPGPLSVGRNGYARKIFLRGFHTSSERFFRFRGFPRGAARSPLFEITSPRPRGIFKGAQPTGVGRSGFSCVARVAFPLKCALWPQGKQFSEAQRSWARALFRRKSLARGRRGESALHSQRKMESCPELGVRGLEAPRSQDSMGTPWRKGGQPP